MSTKHNHTQIETSGGISPLEQPPLPPQIIDYPQLTQEQREAGAFTTNLHPSAGGYPNTDWPQNQNQNPKV
jgi:hypothetical protein